MLSTLTVTSTADSGPGSLRAEVAAASSGDTIVFAQQLSGQTITLNSEIQVNKNLNIGGSTHTGVTISGQNSTRLFEIVSGSVNLDGLTLANGEVNNTDVADGGAVLVDSGATLGIANDTFSGNQAAADKGRPGSNGGAIANAGVLNINLNVTFANNAAPNGSGGAIENSGTLNIGVSQPGGSSFNGNSASNGGAIDNTSTGTVNIISNTASNTFASNSATANGGAISNEGMLTVQANTQFNTNTANGNGGAIENTGNLFIGTVAYLANPQFNGNSAVENGGAIDSSVGQLHVSNTQFSTNTAQNGNGGAIETFSTTTLGNDAFSGNAAATKGGRGFGGAIDSNGTGTLTDTSSTYTNNIANNGNGGAIDTSNSTTLTTDTFDGNQASNGVGGAIANEPNNQLKVVGSAFGNDNVANSGNTAKKGGAIENFGALTVTFDPTTLAASSFVDNTATTNGGAIDSNAVGVGATGNLNVYSALFQGNVATAGSGGAINTADNTLLSADVFQPDKNGKLNTAATAGGAVNATGGKNGTQTLTVNNNSQFTSNQVTGAGDGGAISTSAMTDVETSTFQQNATLNGNGGAIAYVLSNQNVANYMLTVNEDTFTNNTSMHGNGGALSTVVSNGAGAVLVSVTNSLFSSNKALTGVGGGVSVGHFTNGTGSARASFTNDTFFDNQASSGGGMSLNDLTNNGTGTNTADLTSLTFNQNSASTQGGGLNVDGLVPNGTVSVDNSILDGNLVTAKGFNGPLDVTLANVNQLIDKGFNLVGMTDTMFTAKTDILNNNPGLANAPANNNALPGYPQTLALANTSPGYEKGDPSLAGQIDGRGRVRQTGKVSIGAEDPDAQ